MMEKRGRVRSEALNPLLLLGMAFFLGTLAFALANIVANL
jgi:hypothetical protein